MQKEYYKTNETLDVLNSGFPATLKKSILQYAVQGKLVPQDPADEPASVLLKRIHTEKEQLVKEGKIKRDKHESVIFRRDNSYYEKVDVIERCIDDELPFEIPDSWEWTTIGTTCINIQYASDFPFCMALIEAQAKSSTLGSTLKCDGFRVAAMNFGAQLCTCRKRCRDTRLLCKQQGFFLFGQARVHLADDVEIRIVVQQLAGSNGVLTIKDIVVTVTITDLGCVGNALVKFSSDALDAAGVEMPLVVATRNFQKLTVDDHFVMNEFNHRQILLPV